MKVRYYFILFLLGLAFALIPAKFETVPGYMDAEYYYAGGLRLANGYGFSELFLWNYLDDPAGLPHPSHAYWMPLASLLAVIGIKVFGTASFPSAQSGFLLIAACLPPLTALLSFSLTGRRNAAIFSGIIAIFPAFYLPYLVTTDTFGLYMLLGAGFLLVAGKLHHISGKFFSLDQAQIFWTLLLGVLAGLMHLARADGILWLFLAWIVFVLLSLESQDKGIDQGGGIHKWVPVKNVYWDVIPRIFLSISGYLLIMGLWITRNLIVFGTFFSPGGLKALWISSYDELFAYPASTLTFSHWWSAGVMPILQARWWALGQNLVSALAVQGEIIFAPLILLGLWQLRRDLRIQTGFLAWAITFGVMTFVFPFAGVRGGFFHSGAALQPLFWALVSVGLIQFVEWGSRARNWDAHSAKRVFEIGLLGLGILLSAFLTYNRVIGQDLANPAWSKTVVRYHLVDQALQKLGASDNDVVLVNDPPGFFLATNRQSISIPYGNLETLQSVARRYNARYLILEFNQLMGQEDLYDHPGDRHGLHYLNSVSGVRIYKILP